MKKSFVLYLDQYEPIKDLSDAQKGQLFDAMFKYHNDIEFKLSDPFVKMAFSFFKETFKRDSDKYLKRCEKNRENVRKRWNKNDTNVYDGIQTDTKHTDSDSDTIVIEDSESLSDKYSDEIINFANSYQEYISKEFPKTAPEITDKLIESCCDTVEKLIRIDEFTFDEIYKAIQWSAKDDFWSDQIMSLAQLRKKSKNGNKKFVNIYTAYQKKQSPQLNSAEKRLISNIEIGREWLNE